MLEEDGRGDPPSPAAAGYGGQGGFAAWSPPKSAIPDGGRRRKPPTSWSRTRFQHLLWRVDRRWVEVIDDVSFAWYLLWCVVSWCFRMQRQPQFCPQSQSLLGLAWVRIPEMRPRFELRTAENRVPWGAGTAMPTSKFHPARSVVPAAKLPKSTRASAKKTTAAKTSNSPSAGKGLTR